MIVAARVVLVALALLTCTSGATAATDENAGKKQQISQLIEQHDLTTSVSIGNFYRKQEG